MTEKLLQFIWQFGYYNNASLATVQGETLTIISRGLFNKNQGPDFSHAKVQIGGTTLAGHIEVHLRTSDWHRHQHEADPQYKTVVLHVVYHHDKAVNDIPVLELGPRISNLLMERYTSLMDNVSFLPCGSGIRQINQLVFSAWKERLLAERLTRKSHHLLSLLQPSGGHWEEVFWWVLARSFGGKLNGEAFESVARSIPLTVLAKHKSSIHQLEALLLGQAGLLNEEFEDDYPRLLQQEYRFLQRKYCLNASPIPVVYLRMRPVNFPTIRLAQLAMLLHQTTHLFSVVVEALSVNDIRRIFSVTANDFWHYHYTLQQDSSFKKKTLGADMFSNIVINTLAPTLYAYGSFHKSEAMKLKAVRWLEELPAENNHVIAGFLNENVEARSAYDSQALLELKNEYCSARRCLDCSVGSHLLKEAAHTYAAGGKPENA